MAADRVLLGRAAARDEAARRLHAEGVRRLADVAQAGGARILSPRRRRPRRGSTLDSVCRGEARVQRRVEALHVCGPATHAPSAPEPAALRAGRGPPSVWHDDTIRARATLP